jgi:hypothetical protein
MVWQDTPKMGVPNERDELSNHQRTKVYLTVISFGKLKKEIALAALREKECGPFKAEALCCSYSVLWRLTSAKFIKNRKRIQWSVPWDRSFKTPSSSVLTEA